MKPSYTFYRFFYCLARAAISIVYWVKVSGKENIPEGAALVCSNHSSLVDPFLIAFAFGLKTHMHFIAKVELFKIPVVSQVLKKLGCISVNRGILDGTTIKSTFGYLKKNEKVMIFPEGTRTQEDDSVSAKSGAVKLAEHTGASLVPVFIPRKKPLFRRVPLVIGLPYQVEKLKKKRAPDEYLKLADDLMDRIKALNPHAHEGGFE